MEWTMADPAVKVQLFRFIDVLPMLKSAPDIARHLREYFGEAGSHLPGSARWLLRWLPRDGWTAGLVAAMARSSATRLARRFIAGSNVDETLATVARLRRQKRAFTIDRLGEAVLTESEAVQYQQAYLELIDGLCETVNAWPEIPLIDREPAGPLPRVNVSIKLTGLYSQFDPIDPEGTSRAVRERLRPILYAARRQHAFVNLDMEQYAFKDLTLRIFREALSEPDFVDWPDVGIAMQAYLQDTERDLQELADWARQRGTPVWIRLVKGAYWDYETVIAAQEAWPVPVFTHKSETDACFERCTRFLLENQTLLRPALGSHNIRSLAHGLALMQAMDLPPGSVEFQTLYGMAEPIQDALIALGQRVRVYAPYGELLPGMAYLVRRLLENTANESFLRASFTEHVPEEVLLMNPQQASVVRGPWSAVNGRGTGTTDYGLRTTDNFENEPLSDFSREENRLAMEGALAEVKRQLGRAYQPAIGGRSLATGKTVEWRNPSHVKEIIGRWGRATPEKAEQAIAVAKGAFPAWRDTAPSQRCDHLVRAAEVLRRRRFELAAWEVYECGKPWREADADVAETIDYCRYYADQMRRLASPHRFDVPGEENEFLYEPRGVTVVIAPWNFPLAILCGMTTAAVVTGNTVVMKPAEQSSVVAAKLMEVFREAGLPDGVVNYLPGVGDGIGPCPVHDPRL